MRDAAAGCRGRRAAQTSSALALLLALSHIVARPAAGLRGPITSLVAVVPSEKINIRLTDAVRQQVRVRDAVGQRLLDGVVAVRGAGAHISQVRSSARGGSAACGAAWCGCKLSMGARRGAGRSAARGRAIRADDCEKAACTTPAARGCSTMDRGAKTAPHEPDRSCRSARRPARRLWMGAVRGVGRRLPGAGGPKPATAAPLVTSARRRRTSPSQQAPTHGTTTCEGSYSGPEHIGLGSLDQGSTAPVRTLALASF